MKIEIPDSILKTSNWSEKDFLIELACMLYEKTDMQWAAGAKFCGLTNFEFMQELGKRKIAIKYTVQDLEDDMNSLSMLI